MEKKSQRGISGREIFDSEEKFNSRGLGTARNLR